MAPLRDTDTLDPITTQQGYSSDSPLANVIHASLKISNLPKPQNTSATKLGNMCGSVCSRDRPSAVQKMARSKGATPKAATLSTRELQLGQLKTTSESSQKTYFHIHWPCGKAHGETCISSGSLTVKGGKMSHPIRRLLIMRIWYLAREPLKQMHVPQTPNLQPLLPQRSSHAQILLFKQNHRMGFIMGSKEHLDRAVACWDRIA